MSVPPEALAKVAAIADAAEAIRGAESAELFLLVPQQKQGGALLREIVQNGKRVFVLVLANVVLRRLD